MTSQQDPPPQLTDPVPHGTPAQVGERTVTDLPTMSTWMTARALLLEQYGVTAGPDLLVTGPAPQILITLDALPTSDKRVHLLLEDWDALWEGPDDAPRAALPVPITDLAAHPNIARDVATFLATHGAAGLELLAGLTVPAGEPLTRVLAAAATALSADESRPPKEENLDG